MKRVVWFVLSAVFVFCMWCPLAGGTTVTREYPVSWSSYCLPEVEGTLTNEPGWRDGNWSTYTHAHSNGSHSGAIVFNADETWTIPVGASDPRINFKIESSGAWETSNRVWLKNLQTQEWDRVFYNLDTPGLFNASAPIGPEYISASGRVQTKVDLFDKHSTSAWSRLYETSLSYDIEEPLRQPDVFGVFVGYNQWSQQSDLSIPAPTRAGDDARSFRDQLVGAGIMDRENTVLIADQTNLSMIEDKIDSLKLQAGDSLYLYFSGHGGVSGYRKGETVQNNVTNEWDEFIGLGAGSEAYDDELYEMLSGMDAGIQKWVFLDACHSGGFWGNGLEDSGDLDRLSNVALVSAAPEWGVTVSYLGFDIDLPITPGFDYGSILDCGRGVFTLALEDAYSYDWFGLSQYLRADYNRDGIVEPKELGTWLFSYDAMGLFGGATVMEKEVGDIFTFDEGIWNPVVFASEGFVPVSSYQIVNPSVPAPGALVLCSLGSVAVAWLRKRRVL